eukprot:gene33240-40215_t
MNQAPPSFAYVPQGPVHLPIFIGHVSRINDDGQKFSVGNHGDYCQELLFTTKTVSIEGIHIVPNRINPPGVPDFVGRTRPDLSERPFTLQILGRIADSSILSAQELVVLVAITISGGIQWLPLATHLQEIAWDYLVFRGDYEEVSIIMHGVENDMATIAPLPYPAHYDELYSIKESLVKGTIGKPSVGEAKSYVQRTYSEDLELIVNAPLLPNPTLESPLVRMSTSFGSSYLYVPYAAELIECIFSFEPRDAENDVSQLVQERKFLEKANALLQKCWETPSNSHGLKDQSNFNSAEECIGGESVALLASHLARIANRLSLLLQPGASTLASSDNVLEHLLCVVEQLLRCAGLLLCNELTKEEAAVAPLLPPLFSLLACYPPLPPLHYSLVLEVLLAASTHFQLACQYLHTPMYVYLPSPSPSPVLQSLTPYQLALTLLHSGTPMPALSALPNANKILVSLVSWENFQFRLERYVSFTLEGMRVAVSLCQQREKILHLSERCNLPLPAEVKIDDNEDEAAGGGGVLSDGEDVDAIKKGEREVLEGWKGLLGSFRQMLKDVVCAYQDLAFQCHGMKDTVHENFLLTHLSQTFSLRVSLSLTAARHLSLFEAYLHVSAAARESVAGLCSAHHKRLGGEVAGLLNECEGLMREFLGLGWDGNGNGEGLSIYLAHLFAQRETRESLENIFHRHMPEDAFRRLGDCVITDLQDLLAPSPFVPQSPELTPLSPCEMFIVTAFLFQRTLHIALAYIHDCRQILQHTHDAAARKAYLASQLLFLRSLHTTITQPLLLYSLATAASSTVVELLENLTSSLLSLHASEHNNNSNSDSDDNGNSAGENNGGERAQLLVCVCVVWAEVLELGFQTGHLGALGELSKGLVALGKTYHTQIMSTLASHSEERELVHVLRRLAPFLTAPSSSPYPRLLDILEDKGLADTAAKGRYVWAMSEYLRPLLDNVPFPTSIGKVACTPVSTLLLHVMREVEGLVVLTQALRTCTCTPLLSSFRMASAAEAGDFVYMYHAQDGGVDITDVSSRISRLLREMQGQDATALLSSLHCVLTALLRLLLRAVRRPAALGVQGAEPAVRRAVQVLLSLLLACIHTPSLVLAGQALCTLLAIAEASEKSDKNAETREPMVLRREALGHLFCCHEAFPACRPRLAPIIQLLLQQAEGLEAGARVSKQPFSPSTNGHSQATSAETLGVGELLVRLLPALPCPSTTLFELIGRHVAADANALTPLSSQLEDQLSAPPQLSSPQLPATLHALAKLLAASPSATLRFLQLGGMQLLVGALSRVGGRTDSSEGAV